MPIPPGQTIKPEGKLVSEDTVTTEFTKKNNIFDILMASIIFIATAIELISWYIAKQTDEYVIVGNSNNYLLFWYPLLSTITLWFFAGFFLMKVFRYKSCKDTKVITILYFLIQTVNIFAYILKFGVPLYINILYPIILGSLLFIILLKIVQWICIKEK